MAGMPFTDYFLAPDDHIAVTALPDGGPVATDLPTVEAKNVDPVVNLGNLESFLTGLPYDEVVALPRQGAPVSDVSGDEVESVILTVTVRCATPWRRRARPPSTTRAPGWRRPRNSRARTRPR